MEDARIDWDKVNVQCHGKKYMDEMLARVVLNGRVLKSDLSPETNPFKRTFGIGVNFEGC
jgi:hypothetical protein